MDAFVGEFSPLMANAMGMVTRSLRDFQEMFRQMATGRVECRLAQVLLRLVDDLGDPTDRGILIGLPLTRQDLADMIGATIYTVSRTLSQWETEGLVRCGRARVEVLQTGPLYVLAEEEQD